MATGNSTDEQGFAIPRGDPPTAEELRLWAQRKLPAQRLNEVKSHIALDNATFDAAMDTYTVLQNEEGNVQRSPLSGYAPFALAATLLLSVGLYFTANHTPDPVVDPVLRGGAESYQDPRAIALNAGFASARKQSYEGACPRERCTTEQLMHLYGNTLQRLAENCGSPEPSTTATLTELSEQFGRNAELAIWQPDLVALTRAAVARDVETVCSISKRVVATYRTN